MEMREGEADVVSGGLNIREQTHQRGVTWMKMAQGFEAEGDRDVDECDAHMRVD